MPCPRLLDALETVRAFADDDLQEAHERELDSAAIYAAEVELDAVERVIRYVQGSEPVRRTLGIPESVA